MRGWFARFGERRALARRWAGEAARFDAAIESGEAVRGAQRDAHVHFRAATRDLEGFEEVRRGLLVRTLHPEIHAVLKLMALKGASYTYAWGVSLAFVPHATATGTSRHTTVKSARLDLWETARAGDATLCHWTRPGEANVWWIPADFRVLWEASAPAAAAWWERVATPEGVLAVAQEQMEDGWAMTVHHPSPLYVAAFTRARLGDLPRARELLEQELDKWYLQLPASARHPETPERLRRALERIAP